MAGTSIGRLNLGMTLNATQFEVQLTKVNKRLDDLADRAEKTNQAIRGVGFASAVWSKSFDLVGGLIGMTVAKIRDMITSLQEFFSESLNAAGVLEKLSISFRVMTGSAQVAKEMLDGLRQLAGKTPFAFTDLAKAAQSFMTAGFGHSESLQMVARFSDLAAGTTVSLNEAMERLVRALSQMKGKGRVMAQEMLQLSELGVPAWAALSKRLGQFLGRTVEIREAMKLVESGLVDSTIGINAMLDLAADPRFKGLAQEQAKGWLGLQQVFTNTMETLKQVVGTILIDSLDLKGAMKSIIGWVEMVRDNIHKWKPAWEFAMGAAKAVLDVIVGRMQVFMDWVNKMASGVKGTGDAAVSGYSVVISVLKPLTMAFAKLFELIIEGLKLAIRGFNMLEGSMRGTLEAIDYIVGAEGNRSALTDAQDVASWLFTGEIPIGRGGLPKRQSFNMDSAIEALNKFEMPTAADYERMFAKFTPGLGDPAKSAQFKNDVRDAFGILSGFTKSLVAGEAFDWDKTARNITDAVADMKLSADLTLNPKIGEEGAGIVHDIKQKLKPATDEFFKFAEVVTKFNQEGRLDQEATARTLAMAFEDMAGAAEKSLQLTSPAAILRGTKEAYSVVVKDSVGAAGSASRDPVKRLEDLEKQHLKEAQKQTETGKLLLDHFRQRADAKVVQIPK